jgi:hypothetical protein
MLAKVVLDSNVLYSARLRDLWMELGVAGLVSLVWTERIEAEWIVTSNVADFSAEVLGLLKIEIITPDACLLRVATDDNEGFLAGAAAVRARLRSPAIDAANYAAGFARAGCPGIAAWLSARSDQF